MILFVVAVLFSLTQSAIADTIKSGENWGPYQSGNGGEFTLYPSSGALVKTSYFSDQTKNFDNGSFSSGTFQTFCLEAGELIYPQKTYTAFVSRNAINGGVGPQGDPISIGTAYLYSQFAAGTLEDYSYEEAGRKVSAAALQNAIWWLEGEGGSRNLFVLYAETMLSLDDTAVKADANGAYNVMVLNLYLNGSKAQDMLTVVPEPITLMLLGIGLVGVAGFGRKFKN